MAQNGLSSKTSLGKRKFSNADDKHSNGHVVKGNKGHKVDEEPFVFPKDWPAEFGEIDLNVQDLPHASARTEWWYVNSHLKTPKGREFSVFASFFRICEDGKTHEHSVTWAIVDKETGRYMAVPILDERAPKSIRETIESSTSKTDSRLKKAMLEVVEKGRVPLPDRIFSKPVVVKTDALNLDYGGNTFTKDKDGCYTVSCGLEDGSLAFHLKLTPQKPVQRQGNNGVVGVGLHQDKMFYYFIPRNGSVGSVTVDGVKHDVSGSGWYDHEFGGVPPASRGASKTDSQNQDYAWNWLSVQLDDGTDLTATRLIQPATDELIEQYVVVVGAGGKEGKPPVRTEYRGVSFEPLNSWMSVKTTQIYPTKWRVQVEEAKIDLQLQATIDHQEFITLIAKPSFWEGRMEVTGTIQGKPVSGIGFLERQGFGTIDSLDSFFKKISELTQGYIQKVLPLNATYQQTRLLLANDDFDHFMEGVDLKTFNDTIVKPIRSIVDRGGKAWRSFAFLLCIDSVGGDSIPFQLWLAMPEIMHVGSLIVDDIQDESLTRRGGPSCHSIYGTPIAINAGTAAYFLSLDALLKLGPPLSEKQKLAIYDIYFLTLRAGHCGQAFDINGLDYMMEEVIKTGDSASLEKRVLCTHRLKSAVPAGCLARLGCIIGGASKEQVDWMGRYFEAIGLAFQVMDDVLNLRGLPGKTRGEDIMAGKITFPVARAMGLIKSEKERRELWDTIRSKPEDHKIVDDVIKKITDCGGLQQSADLADNMVEDAWTKLNPAIPDSYYKLMLRAFGFFVLQRHY